MEQILKFLNDKFEQIADQVESIPASKQDLDKLNNIFGEISEVREHNKYFKIRPRLQKNQIWSVKNEYQDFLGNTQRTDHPLLVLLNEELDNIEDEDFVRVFVISPFIELSSDSDEVCQDSSIIGFPFLVEKWNNQPVLYEILDEYLGYYEPKHTLLTNGEAIDELTVRLNNYQREFRDIEISKAKYLNISVMALLNFLENKQSQDTGVVISLFNKPEYPRFYIGQNLKGQNFSLAAAKSGNETEDRFFLYKNQTLPFEIFIRRNEDGFIITVKPLQNVKLFSSDDKEIDAISNFEKIVFSNLGKGLYRIISDQIQEPIKIRLK